MYQLISGCSAEEKKEWQLTSAPDYWCCSQGAVYSLQSVDDAKEFAHLKKALGTLNFDPKDQDSLFRAVAGIFLYLYLFGWSVFTYGE
jgi:myosin heavy subunit